MRSLALMLCLLLPVFAGCAYSKSEVRPVSATLEIEVQGQWKKVQRVTYEYERGDK